MSYPSSPNYVDWLRGWKEWARTRKRGRMAQFIIEKLEEGKQAKWIGISSGLFELTEWHLIAKEWFGEKPRNSEEVDAPCMLRKGLPRAFPGLEEVKERSRKEGTQYRSRVFQAPQALLQEVLLHVTNNGPHSVFGSNTGQIQQDTTNDQSYLHSATGYHYTNDGSGFTIPTSTYYPMIQVKSEYPQVTLPSTGHITHMDHTSSGSTTDYTRLLTNGGDRYLHQAQTFRDSELNRMADVIVAGGGGVGNGTETMEAATASVPYQQMNGWPPTEPTVSTLLPNSPPVYIDDISQGGGAATNYSMSSPGATGHTYHHSPVSTHSPRISPEPSHLSTSSYPPSVSDLHVHHHHQSHPPLSAGLGGGAVGSAVKTHQSVMNGALDLSPSNVQSPNIVTDEVSDIMEVKALPNSSPTEGGGHMALVFYQPLPIGSKVVYFLSSSSHGYYQMEQALDENPHTLSCPIPKYPIPEEVELRVFCDQQHIASTSFTFYQQFPSSPEMLLQMLNSQLHSQFQIGGGQSTLSGASGGGASGQTTYSGYVPTSMYQLLLGACRLGCEPLVFCLLCSPIMDKISGEQLKEAYQCASENGHEKLSEHLMEIHLLHDMSTPQLLSRGEGQTTPSHVPAYYDAIDQLDQGGDTPQERAEAVFKHILEAVQNRAEKIKSEEKKDDKKTEEEEEEPVIDDTTPTVEAIASLAITVPQEEGENEPVNDLTPVESGLKRRLSSSSKLKRQTNSISDEGDHERDIPASTDNLKPFSPTRRESADVVSDLPPPQYNYRKLPINQLSDADSAIGLSFDEDGIVQADSCRRSSLLTDLSLGGGITEGGSMGVKVTIPQQSGMEVANFLEWETAVIVTSDYPPNQEKKFFYKGDQIVQIGDHIVRNLDAKSFSEIFQSELSSGSVSVFVIPSTTDRNTTGYTEVPQNKLLLRTPSDQSLFASPPPRINQLLNMKASSQERKVIIPYSSSGFGFKLVGGKTVGLFMTDIRPELTSQVSQGDQVLEINGCITHGLTLYDATTIVNQQTTDLQLTVLENKAKFSTIRDQVELDSFYLRSLIDHTPCNTRDMPLRKGCLLRVVNTFCSSNYWLAWSVDEKSGTETQLKRILTPQGAQKQYGSSIYERIVRTEGKLRPVLIFGSSSEALVTSMCTTSSFKKCHNLEEMLMTYAEGTVHGVMSVKDGKTLQLLSGLHPIILKATSHDQKTEEHKSFDKLNIDGSVISDKIHDLTQQGLAQVNKIQTLPLWKPMGPLLVN